MGDLDGVVLEMLARPLGAGCKERHGVLIIGDDVVQLKANRAVRGLEAPAKPLDHLSHAVEVAAEGAPAGEVPADVLGEELALQRVEVAAPESREAFYRCTRVAIWRGQELLAFGDYKAGWADRTGKICYMRLGARNRVRAAVRATKERWV